MNHLSQKRRLREASARPVREALKESVARCEFCLKPREPHLLACHEIANGNGMRQKALDKPFAILVVCLEPWGQPLCHATVQSWSEAKQLALLYLVSTRFDLQAYLELTSPRAPRRIEQRDVDQEIWGLLAGTKGKANR